MEWINVKDELPTNHNEEVLVVTQPPKSYKQTYLCNYDGMWWSDELSEEIEFVTDWCRIVLPKTR